MNIQIAILLVTATTYAAVLPPSTETTTIIDDKTITETSKENGDILHTTTVEHISASATNSPQSASDPVKPVSSAVQPTPVPVSVTSPVPAPSTHQPAPASSVSHSVSVVNAAGEVESEATSLVPTDGQKGKNTKEEPEKVSVVSSDTASKEESMSTKSKTPDSLSFYNIFPFDFPDYNGSEIYPSDFDGIDDNHDEDVLLGHDNYFVF